MENSVDSTGERPVNEEQRGGENIRKLMS